ncbi:YraN family protein, partial [Myxococcota bacterium]|nr:YraN family protein [Myxococcota bacterium]
YKERGFVLLGKNIAYHRVGELDMVVQKGSLIVFVEVRSRSSTVVHPFQTVGEAKLRRVARAAALFLRDLREEHRAKLTEIRFDLVGVVHNKEGCTVQWCESLELFPDPWESGIWL